MTNLDDPQIYQRLDLSGLRERIRQLPQQCLDAWRKAKNFPLPADYTGIEKVVILGMGGSAIGS